MTRRKAVGRWSTVLVVALGASACSDADAASMQQRNGGEPTGAAALPVCHPGQDVDLPPEARESSGLARSAERGALLWTHNDRGNDPLLIATDEQGRLVQQVRVAASAEDWEDLASAPCGGGSCLYIGDIGDNDDEREEIAVHVLAEPDAGVAQMSPDLTLRARFPDGPSDAESLFVLPGGDVFIVTKGRRHDVSLYRYPSPPSPRETVTLTHVRRLFPEPDDDDDRVTAASSTPDGRWVGIRTYRTLYIYEAEALVNGGPVTPAEIDLASFGEAQGEGLALEDDGTVWLSSEAANRRGSAELMRLSCVFPEP